MPIKYLKQNTTNGSFGLLHDSKHTTSIMTEKTYHSVLIHLMTFVNPGEAYNKDHVFTQAKLAPLTPVDVRRWMCQRAYGTPEPGPAANPTEAQSSSLSFWKKPISFFMPNRIMPWNAVSAQGNPTRSIEVNNLIKRVKKRKFENKGRIQRLEVL